MNLAVRATGMFHSFWDLSLGRIKVESKESWIELCQFIPQSDGMERILFWTLLLASKGVSHIVLFSSSLLVPFSFCAVSSKRERETLRNLPIVLFCFETMLDSLMACWSCEGCLEREKTIGTMFFLPLLQHLWPPLQSELELLATIALHLSCSHSPSLQDASCNPRRLLKIDA